MSQAETGFDERTRVALVNDYEIVLRGLDSMLSPFGDRIEVVEIDVERNPGQVVDVALFDTYGHPRLGLDRISSLASDSNVRAVAVYTWSLTPERFEAARAAGARGVLAKSMPAEALVAAIEQIVHDGEFVSAHFGRSVHQPWPGHDWGLTVRESEVALFLAQGLRNRDIANALWVSENTVKTHLKSIFQKTSVTSRAEAIVRISRDGSFSAKRHEPGDAGEFAKRTARATHPKR
ncbi:MAG TPA: response regulator transcription factor [Acidimicrobiia bacterium]|nr:response regulator transcription factor [Acidimicrobiia bacterium]